ncbi:MAG: hypothetical protein ABI977_02115 [Acidobacteriota bacterium]
MITARQYAKIHSTPYTTVATWLQRDLIPGAEKQEMPYGGYMWLVPDNAPKPDLTPGPKKGSKRATANDQSAASPVTEEKPAKPTKKARGASKKK